jgi:O-antigen/teichoic acid export membrane protein
MLNNLPYYAIGNFVTVAISFLSIPFLTRYLTPRDFGILAIYFMFGALVTNIISVGVGLATERFYYKEINNKIYFSILNFTNVIFLIFMFSIGGIICWYWAEDISKYIFDSNVSKEIIILSYLGGCIVSLYSYLFKLLIPQERAITYSLIQISLASFSMICTIIFILFFSMTFMGRIYGVIITQGTILAILFFLQRKYFIPKLSKRTLIRSLKFSYPTVPGNLLSLGHQSADKIMLTNYNQLDAVGIYQIATKFGEVSKIFINTINQVWTPYFMHKSELQTEEAKVEVAARYQEVVMGYNCCCIIICCFCEEIIILMTTEAYYKSIYIIPLILLYVLLNSSLSATGKLQIMFAEKLSYTVPISLASLIVNIVVNIIMIPRYGMVGAVIATLLASLISSVLIHFIGNRFYPLPINYKKLVGQFILFIAALFPIYLLMYINLPVWINISLKFLILGIYFFCIIKTRLVNIETIILIISRLKKSVSNIF